MDETFEIQTIGRIRRMPEAKHYGSDLLDSCYLYTFDEKFTAGVKMALDKGALNACTLFLKSEYKDITLTGEQRSMISMPRNPQKALRAIWLFAEKSLGVGADKEENRTRLQAAGYILRDDVVRHTVSGETATLDFFFFGYEHGKCDGEAEYAQARTGLSSKKLAKSAWKSVWSIRL